MILVCGASGLVGKEFCKYLSSNNIPFIGTYNKNKLSDSNMYRVDFNNASLLEDFLLTNKVTCCVFCIVERLTDKCENSWNEIKITNIDLVHNTSYLCAKLKIKFIHLSTDYVFDGLNQPNYPDSPKNPLQNYGISKLISEFRVLKNCKDSGYCIIRTPVLYSPLSKIHDNAVCLIGKNLMDLRCDKKYYEDNYSIRRPLYIADLCPFIYHCITKESGVYHFYNPYRKFTKYQMCVTIAKYLQIDSSHIIANNNAINSIAPRPYDTQLVDDKFDIHSYTFTDFQYSIEECFKKFKHPNMSCENKDDIIYFIDLDGTLIDSSEAHYNAYKKTFAHINYSFISFDEWNQIILNDHIDNYLNKNFNKHLIDEIKKQKFNYLADEEIRFTKNSDRFLKYLINNDFHFCIITNTNRATVELFKTKLPLLGEVKNWICRDDCTQPKPSSECYELAKQKYYTNEKYIVGIEDSYTGYLSLKNVTDIIYCYNNENLFKENDCFLFNDFAQIMHYQTLYSPILFSNIADLEFTDYKCSKINMNELNSKDKIIIFCKNSMGAMENLYPFFDNVKKPFVLITAMEDTQVPKEIDGNFFQAIHSNPYFKHWFAINKTIPNDDKMTSIPYGLNYWTITSGPYFGMNKQTIKEQNSLLNYIRQNSIHFSKRIPKCFCNFHFNLTDVRHDNYRSRIREIVSQDLTYFQPAELPRDMMYELMSKYTFVISPFGHGFDCIRTFEALCLGCIVIMKKSFLNVIYEELPVLVVEEWSDISQELLTKTLEDFSTRQFNYEKLTMDYWINLVNSKW